MNEFEVRVRDMDRTRLFVWELGRLVDEMRIAASPHAERLESLFNRYVDGGDDEGEGGFADEVTVEHVITEPCPKCGFAA